MTDQPMECVCGGEPEALHDGFNAIVACLRCEAVTPEVEKLETAIKSWNAMQKEANRV